MNARGESRTKPVLEATRACSLITKDTLAYVQEQIGHHSIQVAVDIYGHAVPEGIRAAVEKLDDASIRNPLATKEKGVSVGLI